MSILPPITYTSVVRRPDGRPMEFDLAERLVIHGQWAYLITASGRIWQTHVSKLEHGAPDWIEMPRPPYAL